MWFLLVLGCGGDADPTVPPAGTVLETGDTAQTESIISTDGTASVTVSQRDDLATWLGFDVVLKGPAVATLECAAPAVANEVHRKQVQTGLAGLHGLLADTNYLCELRTPGGTLWMEEVRTDALPEGLPSLTVAVHGRTDMAASFILVNHWQARTEGQRVMVLDGLGRIRWYAPLDAPAGGVAVMWTGTHVLAAGGKGLTPIRIDLDRTVSFEGPPPPKGHFYHHEVLQTEIGILGLSGMQQVPAYPIPRGLRIEVVDPESGDSTYVYESAAHPDDWPLESIEKEDPFHVNAVLWEDDGSMWLSSRGLSQLLQIDRATGTVLRRVGAGGDLALVDASGAPESDDAWFFGQHAPELQGDHLWVYDNGSSRPGSKQTRVSQYVLDLAAGTATRVWSWTEDGWFEPNFGDVDVLESGHVFVASGRSADALTDPERAFLLELDGDQVVHRLNFDHAFDSLYRAEVIDPCEIFDHAGLCSQID